MKIAITGKPSSGKTTLIKRILPFLDGGVSGFYTEEIRENGKRKGFDIVIIPEGERIPLARLGKRKPRVGKYTVFVENLEKVLDKIRLDESNFIILDEVGKMELLSSKFSDFLEKILDRENVILTYGMGIDRELKEKIERNFQVFEINPANRKEVLVKLSEELKNGCKNKKD